MAGTRSSARQSAQGNSSPPSTKTPKSNGSAKRKAENSSPADTSTKKKRGRPSKASKEQKTLEETMPANEDPKQDDDTEMAEAQPKSSSPTQTATKKKGGRPSKASKAQKTVEETMPQTEESNQDDDTEMTEAKPEAEGANGEGQLLGEFKRPEGCWYWPDDASYDSQKDVAPVDPEKVIKEPGDSFKGETKDGEDKDDPEKALKGCRDDEGGFNAPDLVDSVNANGNTNGNSNGKSSGKSSPNAFDQVKADEGDPGTTSKQVDDKEDEPTTNGASAEPAVEEDKAREEAQPDNVLEKGVIYFFTRGRVGIEDPSSPQELQRSYFVLRPLPAGGKITDGAIQDASNNRLIAVPKKVWPKSGRDRFLSFVEKAGTSMETLREEFLQGSDYSTKTVGTRHTPAVTMIGEGVYAMTSTGSGRTTTHLSYMLTIPQELGEVQKDVGIAEQGSFVLSTKNPESSGPANASLPKGADYPKEIMEQFGSLGWLPTKPEHLDYANAQVLLIGESSGIDAINGDEKDANGDGDKETAQEELEKLEHEDELRIEHMQGDDTVFADLGVSKKDYQLTTTW